ncbi:gamma-glutamyl-gamma-aminobutyrate hydrolase family protein [Amnibacterium sp. CER49]|uniref:gamma-glutamyl-gamma-aminobutyrate hydrolase family protein n=1 Tax=Amnibacterium sp. CER49 TaxID=3039161 RepID=UPI00244ABF78|nr:gamma-glutamyl-gamma-aminobutyrate hydrolase family protein [Amnibacterium sp. CER49]MDH2442574.1 gamma-glutamyl-gamma-aminobutyrate hydrolase family protein [Amnibacterium sp. CER49]
MPAAHTPVIGITTYRQPAAWGTWRDVRADLLPSDYAIAVERAGGVPLLLPVLASAEAAAAAVARVDGLVLAGGADLNPALYGEQPDQSVLTWYDDRDASELWVLAAADAEELPVLGVCRGMQLMATAAGGALVQHLPDVVGHAGHSGTPSGYGEVEVRLEEGTRISSLLHRGFTAPCHHHQAVASHPGYVAAAHDADGVLQAMEAEGERFKVAVQWHPEASSDAGLFEGLVGAAQEARGRS